MDHVERCTHAATEPEDGPREQRIDFIWREVWCVMSSAPPDLVVIEDYAHSQFTASSTLGELGGVVRRELWLRQVPWVVVSSNTVKKFATGDGRASKQQMLEAALPFWPVQNFDEADSLHVMRWGAAHYDELVSETAE